VVALDAPGERPLLRDAPNSKVAKLSWWLALVILRRLLVFLSVTFLAILMNIVLAASQRRRLGKLTRGLTICNPLERASQISASSNSFYTA
jgi:hypothetical protein